MQANTDEVLKQFIERAKLLGASSYLETARSGKIDLRPTEGRLDPQFPGGPSREQLESFVVRLRFFIQDNEPTSLRNISKLLKDDPSVPEQLIDDVDAVRNDLQAAFNSLPPIRVSSKADPDPPTWGEIWDVFIYGELAHANKVKRERYERWMQHGPSFVLFNYYLSRILSVMASGIVFLGGLFEKELQQHAIPPTAPTASAGAP